MSADQSWQELDLLSPVEEEFRRVFAQAHFGWPQLSKNVKTGLTLCLQQSLNIKYRNVMYCSKKAAVVCQLRSAASEIPKICCRELGLDVRGISISCLAKPLGAAIASAAGRSTKAHEAGDGARAAEVAANFGWVMFTGERSRLDGCPSHAFEAIGIFLDRGP